MEKLLDITPHRFLKILMFEVFFLPLSLSLSLSLFLSFSLRKQKPRNASRVSKNMVLRNLHV